MNYFGESHGVEVAQHRSGEALMSENVALNFTVFLANTRGRCEP